MKKLFSILFALGFMQLNAADIVVACKFKDTPKELLVTTDGRYFKYHYGIKNDWDLVFSNSLDEIRRNSTEKWEGFGRYIWAKFVMINNGVMFEFSQAVDRMTDEHEMFLTLTLTDIKTDKILTSKECDLSRHFVSDFGEFGL